MKFSEIVGQERVKSMLARGVDEGRVSHAQLFSGVAGAGGLPLAVAYIQYLNCTDRQSGDSCGVCSSCIKISQLVHPDLHFVFPINASGGSSSQKPISDHYITQWRKLFAETRGYFSEHRWYEAIEMDNKQGIISKAEADEIIRKLSFKSFEADYKAVIIWIPERMRTEAANSLLKILEEPWERTLFVLVTQSPENLLATIISRTQEIAIPRIETSVLASYLTDKHGLSADAAENMARLSGGNLLEANRLAEGDVSRSGEELLKYFTELMRYSYNDHHMELLEWADTMAGIGREQQKRFFDNSIRLLRNSYMLNAGMDNIAYLWGDELAFCKNFAPFIGNHNIEQLVAEMELAKRQIERNANAKILFMHFALTISKMIVRLDQIK